MRILALDLSTRNVGWCMAYRANYVGSGRIVLSGADALQRIAAARYGILALLAQWHPGLMAVEEPISSRSGQRRNYQTDRLLSMLTGVAYGLALADRDCHEFLLVNPRSVIASKCHKRALKHTAVVVGKEHVSGDEADAIGVWLAAWEKAGAR